MERRLSFVADEADRAVALRIMDICSSAEKWHKPCFSHFLTESEEAVAKELLRYQFDECHYFYGGWDGAERKVFCAVPDNFYFDRSEDVYPFKAVTMLFPKGYNVTHRDILGSIMSLRIKREAVGDILVGDCLAVVFLLDPSASLVVSELTKIGGVGVRCSMEMPEELPPLYRTESHSATVSSLRADAVVSAVCNISRSDSAALIAQGLVSKNARVVNSSSASIEEKDKLSIRGHGKFQIENVGGLTRKGRLHIVFNKYI